MDDGGPAGVACSLSRTFTVQVTEVNDPPVGGDDPLSNIAEDSGPRTISLTSRHADDAPGPANESGEGTTITGIDSPVGGSISIVGTDVIFTPDENYNG